MSYYEQLYGEIDDYCTLLNIIKTKINPYEYNFYDFGSGYGKIVNYFGHFFKESIGVEIVKDRYDHSLLNKMNDNVIFINKNFFDVDLKKNFVLLINNLCLKEGTNKRLSQKILDNIQKNSINLVMVSKKLDLLKEYYLNCFTIKCSWGYSEIYFYMI